MRQHATEEISPPPAHAANVSPTSNNNNSGGDNISRRTTATAFLPSPSSPTCPRGTVGRATPTSPGGARLTAGLSISPTTGRSSTGSSFLSSPPAYRDDASSSSATGIFTFRTTVSSSRRPSPVGDDDERTGGSRLPPAVGWRPGCISHSSRALSADCRQHPCDYSYNSSGVHCAESGRLAVKRQKTADSAPSRVNSRLSSRQQSLSQGASKVTLIRGNSLSRLHSL